MKLGVKSIETGFRLLQALTVTDRPMQLNDLAASARLSPSSAHRYLVSLVRTGLVRQDPTTRLYDLGTFAIDLGIATMGRSKLLARAEELQRHLRDQLDETVVLCVWGSYGPVILGVEESSKPIVMTMRVGATMPLFRTATGWIFAAFLPRGVVRPTMRAEIAAGRGPVTKMNKHAISLKLRHVRESSLAFHTGDLLPGVTAVASPLLDIRRKLVAVMSVLGHSDNFDASPGGSAANALLKTVASFSTSTNL